MQKIKDPDDSNWAKSSNPNLAPPWGNILSHVMSQRHASSCAGAVLYVYILWEGGYPKRGEREKDEGGGRLHEFNRDRAVHSGLNAVSSSTLPAHVRLYGEVKLV